MKRSGKWYRKNEAEVMESLGLEPTPNSGSGWVVKEDGQDDEIICQLKSTDKGSITIHKLDLDKLARNAAVSHKTPVFCIQFIQSGSIWLMVRPEDVDDMTRHLTGLAPEPRGALLDTSQEEDKETQAPLRKIVSGASMSRDRFHREQASKYDKTKKAN